jgi:hypothetical protein
MMRLLRLLPLAMLTTVLLFGFPRVHAQTVHDTVLTWVASTTTGVNYVVWRGTVTGGPYTIQNTTPTPSLTYTDTTGVGGTKYFYVIQSTCAGGTCPAGISGVSAFSAEVNATFLGAPAPPTGPAAVAN